MHGLTIKKQITANFSAEQWSLYTSSYLPECIDAAKELNKALEDAVNSGGDRWSCFKQVNIAMQRFENLGATDTEPFIVLWTANVVSSGGTLYRPCLFVYGCSVTPLTPVFQFPKPQKFV